MKAARIHRFGGPEVIAIEEIDRRPPAPGQVLVRVRAAGVGPWDAWVRSGVSVLPQPLPLTLGAEVSGVVEALGDGVDGFAVGDELFGATNDRFTDGYAEWALCSAGKLAAKPRTLAHVAAASVPIVAVTAWQMLFDEAGVTSGQTVLVTGAAGNVGGYAVQLARRAGAHVIGAATPERLEEVRALGADEVIAIDATRGRGPLDGGAPVDVVIDTVGGDVARRALLRVARGGRFVTAVARVAVNDAPARDVRAAFILVRVTTEALARLATLFDEGALATRVGAVLPLSEARAAHALLASRARNRPGKVVLEI